MSPSSVTPLRTQSDQRLVALARAEDALQQALVAAWTALQRGDDVRDLRPWLYRIVHNASLNALRVNGYDYDELRETLEGTGGPAELPERRAIVRDTFGG